MSRRANRPDPKSAERLADDSAIAACGDTVSSHACSPGRPAMNAEPTHAGHLRRSVGFYGLMFVSLGSIIGSGWLFGNIPVVRNNFSLVTIGIVIVSILPMIVEYLRARSRGR